MLSVDVYILDTIIDKGRIRNCCCSNAKCKLSRSDNIINEERSVELITLESFGKENIVCFIEVRSIRCEIHLISPNTTSHDNVFLKTCCYTNLLDRCKTRDLNRLLIFCQSDIISVDTNNVVRNEVRSRMDFQDLNTVVVTLVITHQTGLKTNCFRSCNMTPSNLTVRNITSGVSRRDCCSNATATSSNFINVETIPNTLTNSIQTMWQPLRHIQTSILRSRIRMLSQVNSKLTCIIDECPVDNTIRNNTSVMLRCNSARCASTLCLIDSLLVIDTISLCICSSCLPR